MTILGMMFLMTRNLFRSDNQIYYSWEICINNFYAQVKEVQNAALLSRNRSLSGSISTWVNFVPEWYNIIFKEPRIFWHNQPTYYFNAIENVSGFVNRYKAQSNNLVQLTTWYSSTTLNIVIYDLIPQTAFYRWTGSMELQPLANYHQYNVSYFPLWAPLSSWAPARFKPVSNCGSRDYFVTYRFDGTTGNSVDTLRVGFQTTASQAINTKSMVLMRGRWWDGTNPITYQTNTGALNLMVCNNQIQCRETHRIFFDTRANDIFLQKCSTYGANSKCSSWQWGNIN